MDPHDTAIYVSKMNELILVENGFSITITSLKLSRLFIGNIAVITKASFMSFVCVALLGKH